MTQIRERYLEKVLSKDSEYFVVAKENTYSSAGGFRRGNDSIWLISIPEEIKYNLDIRHLTIREVDKILTTPVMSNIPLSDNFTPFQLGLTIDSFWDAYEVKPTRQFIQEAWRLKSNDLWEYRELNEKLNKKKET